MMEYSIMTMMYAPRPERRYLEFRSRQQIAQDVDESKFYICGHFMRDHVIVGLQKYFGNDYERLFCLVIGDTPAAEATGFLLNNEGY